MKTNIQKTIRTAGTAEFGELKALLVKLAAETEELQAAAGGSVTAVMADWVAGQYLLAVRKELASLPEGPERLKLLRQAAGDVAGLQRCSQRAERLKLDREKQEFEREKHKEEVARRPENRKRPDYLRPLTDEERMAIIAKVDDIMGLPPEQLPMQKAEIRNPITE